MTHQVRFFAQADSRSFLEAAALRESMRTPGTRLGRLSSTWVCGLSSVSLPVRWGADGYQLMAVRAFDAYQRAEVACTGEAPGGTA